MRFTGLVIILISFFANVACLGSGVGESDSSAFSGFNQPWGIVADSSGKVFVSDRGGHRIVKLDLGTNTSMDFAGSGIRGEVDGIGAVAQFSYPGALAIDSQDDLYVGDWTYHPDYRSVIRKVSPSGLVTTVATLPVFDEGYITGLAVASDGTLRVSTSFTVYNVDSLGMVTSVAGNHRQGDVDDHGVLAQFYEIFDIAVDSSDNVWVATSSATGFKIKKVDSSENVTTVANVKSATSISYSDGHLYFLDTAESGDLMRLDAVDFSILVVAANIIQPSRGGGQVLKIHPKLGVFIDSDPHTVKRYPPSHQ